MQTIGLLGGMSWESTATYYQVINSVIRQQLGGLHSAKLLLYSVDFQELEAHMANGKWEEIAAILGDAARRLERAGANFVLICTNTMHKVAPQVQAQIQIPLLHIAQATADALLESGIHKIALLGTKYTMTQDFYRQVLQDNGIETRVPTAEDIEVVDRIIFKELCLGILSPGSKKEMLRIVDNLEREGAQGVVLGCTEIGLLITQQDIALPVFDTALIHATSAAMAALK